MADWSNIPIQECEQKMMMIPQGEIVFFDPHQYTADGAVYAPNASPYMMREEAVDALLQAQDCLTRLRPGYRLKIFDAYRPLEIQAQMIGIACRNQALHEGLDPENLNTVDDARIKGLISQIWANPVDDLTTPPPHSTGGAVDLTIVDENGIELPMGTAIDATNNMIVTEVFRGAAGHAENQLHQNRMLLMHVMERAGFLVNANEWWHFDIGNQRHAYETKRRFGADIPARFGRVMEHMLPAMPGAKPAAKPA